MTAMVLLTAHSIHRAGHTKVFFDKELVDAGLKVLDRIVEETKSDDLRSVRDTCIELQDKAQQRRRQDYMIANSRDLTLSF